MQSFTASGAITYYWAGKPVQGPATILANGTDQFRIDATLPPGTESVAISHGSGTRKDPNGALTAIPLHNTLAVVILSFPYPQLAAALSDTTAVITDLGLVSSGGKQLHQVSVVKTISKASDPSGLIAPLTRIDYFLDPQTNLVAKTEDQTHPVETLTQSFPHDMELESYTTFNGVAVPTIIREKISGQTLWEFRLSAITFNTPLTDASFTIQ